MTISALLPLYHPARESLENFLKLFFECGITPDFAEKPEDVEVLKGVFELVYLCFLESARSNEVVLQKYFVSLT